MEQMISIKSLFQNRFSCLVLFLVAITAVFSAPISAEENGTTSTQAEAPKEASPNGGKNQNRRVIDQRQFRYIRRALEDAKAARCHHHPQPY